jgi:hypothetical protein
MDPHRELGRDEVVDNGVTGRGFRGRGWASVPVVDRRGVSDRKTSGLIANVPLGGDATDVVSARSPSRASQKFPRKKSEFVKGSAITARGQGEAGSPDVGGTPPIEMAAAGANVAPVRLLLTPKEPTGVSAQRLGRRKRSGQCSTWHRRSATRSGGLSPRLAYDHLARHSPGEPFAGLATLRALRQAQGARAGDRPLGSRAVAACVHPKSGGVQAGLRPSR